MKQVLQERNWPNLSDRCNTHSTVLVSKALYKTAPSYFK